MCLPLYYDKNFEFIIPITSNVMLLPSGVRVDINDIFSPDYWFPIEINVPDTFIGAWQNIGSAWQFASDYLSMSNAEMSHYGNNQN